MVLDPHLNLDFYANPKKTKEENDINKANAFEEVKHWYRKLYLNGTPVSSEQEQNDEDIEDEIAKLHLYKKQKIFNP
ncbi:hypothetical protein HK096_008870, partial [Nowakowskiella sp. JEL0078]